MTRLKNYYMQCKTRDNEDHKYTQKFLRKLLTKIPLKLKKENKTHKKNLAKIVSNVFTNFGVDTFFRFYIGINDRNSSEHIIKLDQPTFTFPNHENYNKKENQNDKEIFYEYFKIIFKLIYDKTISMQEVKKVVDFEYELGSTEMALR